MRRKKNWVFDVQRFLSSTLNSAFVVPNGNKADFIPIQDQVSVGDTFVINAFSSPLLLESAYILAMGMPTWERRQWIHNLIKDSLKNVGFSETNMLLDGSVCCVEELFRPNRCPELMKLLKQDIPSYNGGNIADPIFANGAYSREVGTILEAIRGFQAALACAYFYLKMAMWTEFTKNDKGSPIPESANPPHKPSKEEIKSGYWLKDMNDSIRFLSELCSITTLGRVSADMAINKADDQYGVFVHNLVSSTAGKSVYLNNDDLAWGIWQMCVNASYYKKQWEIKSTTRAFAIGSFYSIGLGNKVMLNQYLSGYLPQIDRSVTEILKDIETKKKYLMWPGITDVEWSENKMEGLRLYPANQKRGSLDCIFQMAIDVCLNADITIPISISSKDDKEEKINIATSTFDTEGFALGIPGLSFKQGYEDKLNDTLLISYHLQMPGMYDQEFWNQMQQARAGKEYFETASRFYTVPFEVIRMCCVPSEETVKEGRAPSGDVKGTAKTRAQAKKDHGKIKKVSITYVPFAKKVHHSDNDNEPTSKNQIFMQRGGVRAHAVRGHIRQLPIGWSASVATRKAAESAGLDLPAEGFTYVAPYFTAGSTKDGNVEPKKVKVINRR